MFCEPSCNNCSEKQIINIALDARRLNEVTVKIKTQTPNIEELLARRSRETSEGTDGEFLSTKFDFDYAYDQMKLAENTKNLGIFTVTGGNYCFLEKILWTGG